MGRRPLVLLAVSLAALLLAGPAAAAWTKTDQRIAMDDGVELATSLYLPVEAPPVGGHPAVVMFHGLGGTRASVNTIAEQTFANQRYAVLTFDFRGHGASGGLFGLDGPRELQDTRALLAWLQARPDIDDAHIGAWGISLGGGMVWQALEAGLPFAAAEVFETWIDLYAALAPHDLSKSGAIFQFLGSVPAERIAPEILAIRDDALNSRNMERVRALADSRSSFDALSRIRVPVEIFQGRRDFAFDLDQGLRAYRGLAGPKRLYIGDFGHAPSTFPGPDANAMFLDSLEWFGEHLQRLAAVPTTPVEIAPDPWTLQTFGFAAVPAVTAVRTKVLTPNRTFGARGKVVLTFPLPNRKLELFGKPAVTLKGSTRTRAPQVVGVLEALAPNGTATLITDGGRKLPDGAKRWTTSFGLVSTATLIPKGSKLRLTISWTSTAQSPANLLYLTGVPDGSSMTVSRASVSLPVLRQPISG